MNHKTEDALTLAMQKTLAESERELQADADLQRQLQAIRSEALTHIPAPQKTGVPVWMMGGALACAAIVTLSVLLMPGQNTPHLLMDPELLVEQEWLATEAELPMEFDSFEFEPDFYNWAVENSDHVDS